MTSIVLRMKVFCLVFSVSVGLLTCCAASVLSSEIENPAAQSARRDVWLERHNRTKTAAQRISPVVVFIGDSITAGWASNGKGAWAKYMEPLPAANFGISGDRTENVLWRLREGKALEKISPKLIVIMIGTNNLSRDSAEQIAEGIAAITNEVLKQMPSAKVLLLGVFPRNESPDDPIRMKVSKINEIIAKIDNKQTVFFFDLGDKLVQPDGTISKTIMPDFLHLSDEGYAIWAQAINEKIRDLL